MQPLRFLGMRNGRPTFERMASAPTAPNIVPTANGGIVQTTPHGYVSLPYVLLPHATSS